MGWAERLNKRVRDGNKPVRPIKVKMVPARITFESLMAMLLARGVKVGKE